MVKKELLFINIMAIRSVKNWNTPKGKKDCIVIILKSGVIIFLDADTLDNINMIELEHTIIEIEFHPKKSIMLIVDTEFLGSIMKIYKFSEDGRKKNIFF